jgi:hypothetical protein
MFGLSGEILQASAQVKPPPKYDPSQAINDGSKDTDGNTLVPPPIPPTTTFDPGNGSSHSSSSSTSVKSPSSTGSSADPGAQAPAGNPPARQPGLVLGGATTTPAPMPAPPVTGIAPPSVPGGGGFPGAVPPSLLPGVPNTLQPVSGLPFKSGGGFGGGTIGAVESPATGMRAMAPGGVIGGTPSAILGQPGAGTRPPSRVNPVGGVIEPRGTSAGSMGTTRGSAARGQSLESIGSRNGGRRDEQEDTIRWDSDNPWVTAEGVSPVVLPATEQRVDPGPAIGLS